MVPLANTIHTLEIGDFETRWDVAKDIAASGVQAIPYLDSLLKRSHLDEDLEWFVLRILGGIPCPQSVLLLTEHLEQTQDEEIRELVTDLLARMGAEALPALQQGLNGPYRLPALKALAQMSHGQVIPVLLAVARTATGPEQAIAFTALDKFHSPDILQLFIDGLASRDETIRQLAIAALGRRKHEYPVQDLVTLLADFLWDDNLDIAIATAQSLGRLTSGHALSYLQQRCCEASTPSSLKPYLIRALSWIGSQQAISALDHIRQSWQAAPHVPPELLQELVQALDATQGQVEQQVASQALTRWLASDLFDANSNIKAQAILTLGHLGQESAIAPLIQLLADANPRIRLHAIAALKQLQITKNTLTSQLKLDHLSETLKDGISLALHEW